MRQRTFRLLFVGSSVLVAAIVGELFLRLKSHELTFAGNVLARRYELARAACGTAYDPDFGWLPRPEKSHPENRWGTRVTILQDGIRANRADASDRSFNERPLLLAAGDSFTFGDQVNDEESWPAQLEASSSYRVLNAGVCGFGIDQSLLRAEALTQKYDPDVVVLSFIGPDLERATWTTEPDAEQAPRPYFAIADGALVLHNRPAPKPVDFRNRLGPLRELFGYSFLVDRMMLHLNGRWWNDPVAGQRRPKLSGASSWDIGCAVVRRFAKLASPGKRRAVLLAQGLSQPSPRGRYDDAMDSVLACAPPELTVVDTRPTLDAVRAADPKHYAGLYMNQAHMSREGNALMAKLVLEALPSNQSSSN